jgi:ATP-binding cassette subfamily C (CFTR/MRP) protein 1
LTIIVGPVGSGKSTFCKALLGEVPNTRGDVFFPKTWNRIGFHEQAPFLPNASARGMIVGFSQFDAAWYKEVIQATALQADFDTLANGDHVLVGTNGASLSGGQRHRMAIARAIYARPNMAIFDDVFSGLDTSTEDYVFQKVFGQ